MTISKNFMALQFLNFASVTVFWKTDHNVTNTEIHYLPVHES